MAVIGPNADSRKVLLGNYFGTSSQLVTALEGIRRKLEPNCRVLYAEGCDLTTTRPGYWGTAPGRLCRSVGCGRKGRCGHYVHGRLPRFEGEEGAAANSDGGGDRLTLELPGMQNELIKEVAALGKPLVLVLFSGSPWL